jgi:hypothetical protein
MLHTEVRYRVACLVARPNREGNSKIQDREIELSSSSPPWESILTTEQGSNRLRIIVLSSKCHVVVIKDLVSCGRLVRWSKIFSARKPLTRKVL